MCNVKIFCSKAQFVQLPRVPEITHSLNEGKVQADISKICFHTDTLEAAWLAAYRLAAHCFAAAEVASFCPSEFVPGQPVAEHGHVDGEGHEHPGEGDPGPPGVVVFQAQMRGKVGSLKHMLADVEKVDSS